MLHIVIPLPASGIVEEEEANDTSHCYQGDFRIDPDAYIFVLGQRILYLLLRILSLYCIFSVYNKVLSRENKKTQQPI